MSLRKCKIVAAVAALCFSASSFAITPAAVIAGRQARFKEMGRQFKSINDGLRAGSITPAMRADAGGLARHSRALPGWFPAGSAPAAGVETRARMSIWTDSAGFAAKARAMAAEAGKLEVAMRGGDADAAKEQAMAVGRQCGGCHAAYREKD